MGKYRTFLMCCCFYSELTRKCANKTNFPMQISNKLQFFEEKNNEIFIIKS